MEQTCPCVGKHIPKVMTLIEYKIWPTGPATDENVVNVCPTTAYNIKALWSLYDLYNGRPPWKILREYSEFSRECVERGREFRRQFNASIRITADSLLGKALPLTTVANQMGEGDCA